jgi:hypothetical protein
VLVATSVRNHAVPPVPLRPAAPPPAGRTSAAATSAPPARSLLHWVPVAVGVGVAVLAGVVLVVGWGLDVDVAKGFTPARATIRPLTAICLLLLAVSLPQVARDGPWPRRVATAGAGRPCW